MHADPKEILLLLATVTGKVNLPSTLRSKNYQNITGKKKTGAIFETLCSQSSVAIEIPVRNPQGELLMLDVYLEGDDLNGANWVSVPPGGTLTYKVMFSPGRVGKSTGR